MALVKWNSAKPFGAVPVQQLSNGDWLMRTLESGARFTVGTMIQVKEADIVKGTLYEDTKADPGARAAELEAALAEERKGLPTVAELLAKSKDDKAKAAPEA